MLDGDFTVSVWVTKSEYKAEVGKNTVLVQICRSQAAVVEQLLMPDCVGICYQDRGIAC